MILNRHFPGDYPLIESQYVNFICPICHTTHTIQIDLKELQQARGDLKLIQKAYDHEDQNQVIIVHIDWEYRVRRIAAYNFSTITKNNNTATNQEKMVNNNFNKPNISLKNDFEDKNNSLHCKDDAKDKDLGMLIKFMEQKVKKV